MTEIDLQAENECLAALLAETVTALREIAHAHEAQAMYARA
jgi:hypothetical protein